MYLHMTNEKYISSSFLVLAQHPTLSFGHARIVLASLMRIDTTNILVYLVGDESDYW